MSCAPEAVEAVAEILREHGAPGVAIEGLSWVVGGDDVSEAPPAEGPAKVVSVVPARGAQALRRVLQEELERRVAPYFGPAQVLLQDVPAEDWVEHYRRSVRPALVAPGIVVAPPWADADEAAAVAPGARILWIEPGAAFGTGDHPSTRTTLRAGLGVLRPGDDVIDLGCGTGILGAAALLMGAGELRAYDLDPLAARASRDTLRRNGLSAAVRRGPLPQGARPADLVFANLSGSALRPLLGRIRRAVRAGGHAVLGGVLREDATFAQACESAGLPVVGSAAEGDWIAFLCQRR